jgi:hypothetical protein
MSEQKKHPELELQLVDIKAEKKSYSLEDIASLVCSWDQFSLSIKDIAKKKAARKSKP